MKMLPFGTVYEPVETVLCHSMTLTNSCFSPSLAPKIAKASHNAAWTSAPSSSVD